MRRPRRNDSAAFKARVALEAIRGEETLGSDSCLKCRTVFIKSIEKLSD